MKATIVKIGLTYQFHGECDICKGREGRRYDARFRFDCGGELHGIACSPCWAQYAKLGPPNMVVDLQGVTEHAHLNDDKRVWPSISHAQRTFEGRCYADGADVHGEVAGTEYELVWPEARARVYRHYGDEPCPWKPAPLPEPITGQLLTALQELMAAFGGVTTHPEQDKWDKAKTAIARAEKR